MIAIIFGGKSSEHNVSIVTGVELLNATRELDVLPVYIDREGFWHTGKELFDLSTFKKPVKAKKVFLKNGGVLCNSLGIKVAHVDVAVLCTHGANGEDGTLQGMLTMLGVPFTGSGVLQSALCMDKATFKKCLSSTFPLVPGTSITKKEYFSDIYAVADRLNALGYPFIVKPSRAGSSIGIGKASDEAEFVAVAREAYKYDNEIVVEKLLTDFREFNCAAISHKGEITVSEVEEPTGFKDYMTYDDKYAGKVRRNIPAQISEKLTEEIQSLTKRAYSFLGLSGVVRIDFMESEGKLYLNEINTLPGSLATYFFMRLGMTQTELVQKLVEDARERYENENSLKRTYYSEILGGKV